MNNDEILKIREKHYLNPWVVYHKTPLQLTKAKGQYVYDEKGKEYLDCIGGIVSISAGHNHPKIKAKLSQMLANDEIQHTTQLYLNEHLANLTVELLKEAPAGIDRAFFTNSGSEANETAFLAVRQATGESMIVNLRHSYHGGTATTLGSCGHASWRFRAQPVANVTSALEPYCYRCPFGKTNTTCALECAKNVETTIQTTTHGKIAGFIAEPVMGVGGFITPPKEYFDLVAKIVKNYGGKYISDEVQTGAGRCGENFLLTKSLGIPADVVTMAKGFGNGAAIGAMITKSEISESMKGKMYFNTFGGDPYQTAQAKITMDIIREEKLIQNAKTLGNYLTENLRAMMNQRKLIGDVRGRGLLMGIELVKNRDTKEHASLETAALMDKCKDKGVLLGKGGLMGNVLRIAPPMNITKENCDTVLKAIDESLMEIEKGVA